MADKLVIVESPAKARTITKFLGPGYKVLASMGHVRDLPKSKMGVDVEGDFSVQYQNSKDKTKVLKELKDELKNAKSLWLATDEDREGEAIGWHLLSALKVPKDMPVHRIVFHEITKGAILEAIDTPRELNMNIVNAQQARRVLDRLVGYELSPFLWKKVKYGLSAGRVQSVAVRIIVEREREIQAFNPEEYWSITGLFDKEGEQFEAAYRGKIANEAEAKKIESDVDGVPYKVSEVVKKEVKRNPAPPFITSTLQQEASRKLGYSVKQTMMLAQRLYEGMEDGEVEGGLITYMRTDSVNLSKTALKQAKDLITKEYGNEYALEEPRMFKGKKGAQEAHEAIRPTNLSLHPSDAAKFLEKDQARLYELIWKRTLACQMKEAIVNRTTVDVSAAEHTFRATGQSIKFAGFIKAYTEGQDEGETELFGEKILPDLNEGDELKLEKLDSEQHFTKPPARYTEASLVKKMESEGIGRPSTYSPTISTIIARQYVEKEGKSLMPTDLAMMVTDVLVKHFKEIIDYKFTADMEDKLDAVEEGKQEWVPMIKAFYTPFHKSVVDSTENVSQDEVFQERVLGKDPKTGLDIVVRRGRFGPFVQVGQYTKEEVAEMKEKPRRASLMKGDFAESVTMEQALKCLSLPRTIGQLDGVDVIVSDGRFGPYMKIGSENVSLPKDADPYEVELEEMKVVIAETRERKKKYAEPVQVFGKDPATKEEVQIRIGRYGAYATDGITNASLGKNFEAEKITEAEAFELLVKKRKAPKRNYKKK